MKLWTRLIAGDGMRKTRLHNYRGERIDLAGLRYAPRAALSVLNLKLFQRRAEMPWLGYRAVNRIASLIRPEWTVLEYGSGMSSLWFAPRCARLISIEQDVAWHERMRQEFSRRSLSVDYRLCTAVNCLDLPDVPDHSVDFALVDGYHRDVCAAVAVRKVKPGGWIHLDNSDVPYGEHRTARQTLLDAAAHVEVFNDFYPGLLAVNEGTLVRVTPTPTAC